MSRSKGNKGHDNHFEPSKEQKRSPLDAQGAARHTTLRSLSAGGLRDTAFLGAMAQAQKAATPADSPGASAASPKILFSHG